MFARGWPITGCCGRAPALQRLPLWEPFLAMISAPSEIRQTNDLRTFVLQAICEHNGLEANASPITERPLFRGGKPCGLLFCVRGPRSVTFTAIWDRDKNTVLLYGSAGEQQHRTKLSF